MSIPKLRFKEFNNNWEYYKIKDIFENISIKNHPEMTILTIIQGNGTIPRSQSNRNIIFDEEKSFTYKVVNKNDFIIHLRSFEGGLEMSNHNGIVSPAYTIIRGNNKVIPLFFKYYFRTNKFINGILSKAVEGIRDGRQISYNQLKDFNIPLPSLEEQTKISDFLSLIDKKIELQTQLVDNLNLYKKGLLQKVFSNNSGWKTVKIGDILQYEQPNQYIVESTEYNDKFSIPVLTANKGFILGYTNENFGVYIKGECIIFDDFTMDFKFVNFPYKVKSSAIKILTTKNNNIRFIYQLLKTITLEPISHQRHYISVVQNIDIKIPSLEEQNQIAELFTNLDKKIDFETKKLENLKTYKKGLLQKMFI